MNISEPNQKAIQMLADELDIDADVVLDNIVTDFRARRAAQNFEGVTTALYAFTAGGDSKESAVVYTGARLYDYLVATYRAQIQQQQARMDGRTRKA